MSRAAHSSGREQTRISRHSSGREQTRVSRPPVFGEPELLHATYVTHRFPRHAHDGYGVGVVERGALGFRYRGEQVVASAGSINLVVPDEPHTGEAASEVGWTYRMFYLQADLMEAANRSVAGRSAGLPYFRPGVLQDATLAGRLALLHRDLAEGREGRLSLEVRLLALLRCFISRHGTSRLAGEVPRAPLELERTRAFIRAEHARDLRLAELASIAGLSPWHLARAFTRAFGMPPHAYQVQVRVGEARRLLARGRAVAEVAAATGFTDQSHLTRHFKRLTGITPGRYRKNVQD